MAGVTVYGYPGSTAVARVLACLYEKNVDFSIHTVDTSKGQQKSPDFLKLQPFGQIPAFQDGTLTLFESRAICRYVCDKYADRGNRKLLPGSVERALVEQWLEAEAQSFHPPSLALVTQLVLFPRKGLKPDAEAIEKSEERLAGVLDVYDRRLGESRYLAGDDFSLADLSHLPNAEYLVNATEKGRLVMERKNVARWWEEISGRESWRKVIQLRKAPTA